MKCYVFLLKSNLLLKNLQNKQKLKKFLLFVIIDMPIHLYKFCNAEYKI